MRIRMSLRRGGFFVVAFLLAAIALLPLRLALDAFDIGRTGVAAREAIGSVWGGALRDTQFRDTRLGDLDASLGALPLLAGRARIRLGRNDGALASAAERADRFEGAVTVTRNSYAVADLTARLPLAAQFAPLPVTALDTSALSARFVAGACASASGAVTITTAGNLAGVPLPATMTGNARCDGAALLLPLAGAAGEQLDLRFTGGDRYRATLTVRPIDVALQQRLALAGFTVADGAYSLGIDGRLN